MNEKEVHHEVWFCGKVSLFFFFSLLSSFRGFLLEERMPFPLGDCYLLFSTLLMLQWDTTLDHSTLSHNYCDCDIIQTTKKKNYNNHQLLIIYIYIYITKLKLK